MLNPHCNIFSKLNAVMLNKDFDCIQLALELAEIITMKPMQKLECANLISQCLDAMLIPFLDQLNYPAAVAAAYCIVRNKVRPSRRFMITFTTFLVIST